MLHKWIIPIVLFVISCISCQKDWSDEVNDLLERVSKLEKICDQANTDISGLKQIVSLLEANDYITSVNELADKSGYALNFLKGNTIVIKHGTNGSYPVLGVDEFENVFYWTQKIGDAPSSWILDSKGNKIQATGVNGKTPVIDINTHGNWTIDYGEGAQEIKVNGKPVSATGKDGANGKDGIDGVDGKDGYSPFQSVVDKGDYVEIRLATGAVLKLSKWNEKMMKISFDMNADNLISDVLNINEEKTVSYYIENPDPQASVYFEATNGWIVEHYPDNQSILLKPYAAYNEDGRIVASIMNDNKLISQFRFSVKANLIYSPLKADNVMITPNVLEAIGGKVPVTINITFPMKWFCKEAVITVTPVLRYADGEAFGTSYTFQGENVKDNNLVIPYDGGADVTMKSAFNYKSEMKKSELYLTFDAKIQDKTCTIPDVKIGEGVIAQ